MELHHAGGWSGTFPSSWYPLLQTNLILLPPAKHPQTMALPPPCFIVGVTHGALRRSPVCRRLCRSKQIDQTGFRQPRDLGSGHHWSSFGVILWQKYCIFLAYKQLFRPACLRRLFPEIWLMLIGCCAALHQFRLLVTTTCCHPCFCSNALCSRPFFCC